MLIRRDCIYTPKGKNRPLHIWLPEDWETSGKRYPVMYFFDGHNLFRNEDATYGKSWGLKEFLDSWGKKIIIVGIECGHEGDERLSEYLPYRTVTPAKWSMLKPMGRATMEWIVKELKPMIDAEYRTIPFRECTAIGGSSMGGIMSLYGAVCYNAYFSKAACVSRAVGFCIRRVLKDIRQQEISPDTRVYLSWGTKESFGGRASRWNRAIEAELKNRGCATLRYCQHGGKHG